MVVSCEKFRVLSRDLVQLATGTRSVGAWIRSACLGEDAALGGGSALSTGTRPRPENLL